MFLLFKFNLFYIKNVYGIQLYLSEIYILHPMLLKDADLYRNVTLLPFAGMRTIKNIDRRKFDFQNIRHTQMFF